MMRIVRAAAGVDCFLGRMIFWVWLVVVVEIGEVKRRHFGTVSSRPISKEENFNTFSCSRATLASELSHLHS